MTAGAFTTITGTNRESISALTFTNYMSAAQSYIAMIPVPKKVDDNFHKCLFVLGDFVQCDTPAGSAVKVANVHGRTLCDVRTSKNDISNKRIKYF